MNVIPIIFPASNDNQYFRMKGINCYGLFPVYISEELLCSIHNANERIPIQALEDGTEVYTQFLRSVLARPTVAEKNTAVNLQQSK